MQHDNMRVRKRTFTIRPPADLATDEGVAAARERATRKSPSYRLTQADPFALLRTTAKADDFPF